MGDKIILQFDREDLERKCRACLKNKYKSCSKTDDDLINCCLIWSSPYKILKEEQKATDKINGEI